MLCTRKQESKKLQVGALNVLDIQTLKSHKLHKKDTNAPSSVHSKYLLTTTWRYFFKFTAHKLWNNKVGNYWTWRLAVLNERNMCPTAWVILTWDNRRLIRVIDKPQATIGERGCVSLKKETRLNLKVSTRCGTGNRILDKRPCSSCATHSNSATSSCPSSLAASPGVFPA